MKQKMDIPSELQTEEGRKHGLLLHACCAPCSLAIVEWLLAHDIRPTLFYYNPNILPQEEYAHRKEESKRHAIANGIEWIEGDYDTDHWFDFVKGYEQEPERGRRCELCFLLRLRKSFFVAKECGFKVVATTLASSRWKSLEQVNAAGVLCEQEVEGVVFWERNWRKGGLQERRNQLLREGNYYNQLYCGCPYSARRTV